MNDLELADKVQRFLLGDPVSGGFSPEEWQQIIAALRRGPERPPSGEMVMVPREPTEKMIRAGIREGDSDADWKSCYHAMLSAAEASKEAK